MAAEKGGREVALPVLAATLTTVVVFFPVTFLYGVSKFLFSALALAVVLSLFASFAVAMTVVPLFCARFIKAPAHHGTPSSEAAGDGGPPARRRGPSANASTSGSTTGFESFLKLLRPPGCGHRCGGPSLTLAAFGVVFAASLRCFPLLGLSFFPRTDAGQFVINLKAPSGTRLAVTENEVAKVENLIRQVVSPEDLGMIVSNIGSHPGLLGHLHHQLRHAHRVRAGEPEGRSQDRQLRVHERGSSRGSQDELPELTAYFQSGGLVDAVLNLGLPAPIDVQVAGSQHGASLTTRRSSSRRRSATSPAWPMSSSRRTSTIRRCSSTWTACAPASWAWISGRWWTT